MGSTLEPDSGQKMVLLLASESATPDVARFPLDRIRIQKAVFLISMRGPARWQDSYNYRPYDWGPYSDELNTDIHVLRAAGLMRLKQTSARYESHVLTMAGEGLARGEWEGLSLSEKKFLRDVRKYVTNKSFNGLLREVYAAYPEYATHSRFHS